MLPWAHKSWFVFVCGTVCTCMLLRPGFISIAAWISLRPEIKLIGLQAQSLRLTTACELDVIQTQLLEEEYEPCRLRLIARNAARWQENVHLVSCSWIYKCECLSVASFYVCVLVCDSGGQKLLLIEEKHQRLEWRKKKGFQVFWGICTQYFHPWILLFFIHRHFPGRWMSFYS